MSVLEQDRLDILTRTCTRCWQMKTWREFPVRKYWEDGTVRTVLSCCRPCQNALSLDWQARHGEARRAYSRRWERRKRAAIRAEARAAVASTPVRDVVMQAIEGGLTWKELAARTGVDDSQLHREVLHAETMVYERAVQVVRAIGVDPVDVGL